MGEPTNNDIDLILTDPKNGTALVGGCVCGLSHWRAVVDKDL